MTERNERWPDECEPPGALNTSIEADQHTDGAQGQKQSTKRRAATNQEAKATQAKRPARKRAATKQREEKVEGRAILHMPARDVAIEERAGEDGNDADLQELEAQGFTPDEAQRLLYISDRLSTSREAREAEATLRRLRFTRWLIEHGMQNEFSA